MVEKLGIREVGYAPRFLHIDGAWRDHRIYAITVEECPDGMLARLGGGLAPPRRSPGRPPRNHTSHTSDFATHLWTSAPGSASEPNL